MTWDIKHDYKKKILKSFFRKKIYVLAILKKCYYETEQITFLTDWMKDDGIGKLNFSNTLTSVIQLFSLIGVIIVIGFLLGYLESLTRMYWSRAFGRKGFLLTAWIGVPIHELGHAIMCVLFRHKIVATQFFPTDTSQGALGYVQHQYNHKSVYQRIGNFFIGIGPIISGITALILLMRYFVPDSYFLFHTTLEKTITSTLLM